MATAVVRLALSGGRRIKNALKGLRSDTKKTNRESRRESKRTEQAQKRSSKASEKAVKDSAKKGADSVEKAEKRKRKAIKGTAREEERSDRSSNRRRRRNGRGSGGRRRGFGAVAAGAAVGALAGVRGAAQTAQGVIGVRSQQDVLGSLVDTRANLVRNLFQGVRGAGAAGEGQNFGALTENVIGRASSIGRDRGISTESILNAVANSQSQFSQLATAIQGGEQGMDRLFSAFDFMAQTAQATGSSMESVSTAGFALQRGLGLSADELDDALGIVAQQALDGSITMEDFATRFPQIIGTFRQARGTSGLDALREFGSTVQAVRTASGADPRVVRTSLAATLSALSNTRTQQRLSRAGIDVSERDENGRATGRIRSLGDIAQQFAAANGGRGFDLGRLQTLLGNQQAAAGAGFLGAAESSGMTLNDRIAAQAGDGIGLIQGASSAVLNDASGQALVTRAEREARLAESSGELITQFNALARALTRIEDAFPRTNMLGGSIAQGIAGGAGVGLGARALLGGGGAAAAAGAGGITTAGGAAAGAGPIAAAVGAGAVIGLGAGRGLAHLADSASGAREGEGLVEAQNQAVEALGRSFGIGGPGAGLGQQLLDGFRFLLNDDGPARPTTRRDTSTRTQPVSLDAASQAGIGRAVAEATPPGEGRRGDGGGNAQ